MNTGSTVILFHRIPEESHNRIYNREPSEIKSWANSTSRKS